MGARRAVVVVDDDHGVDDGHDVHEECEYEVLGDERYDHGGWRQDLGDEEQEDDQGEQDGYAQGHLFALVRGQVEDEYAEEADEDRGYDEVDGVEEGLAADFEGVDELHAVGVDEVDLLAGHLDDVPGAAGQVVLQVDHGLLLLEAHLQRVKGPGAEAHLALLLVEGKVLDVDGARALVDGGRYPEDVGVVGPVLHVRVHHHVGLVARLVVAVGVVEEDDVGRPHAVVGHAEGAHFVVVRCPVQLEVGPAQIDPHVGFHDLLLFVLGKKRQPNIRFEQTYLPPKKLGQTKIICDTVLSLMVVKNTKNEKKIFFVGGVIFTEKIKKKSD